MVNECDLVESNEVLEDLAYSKFVKSSFEALNDYEEDPKDHKKYSKEEFLDMLNSKIR